MALSNPELLAHLINLAESLDINVREDSIEESRGGLYILKGKRNLLINKDLIIEEKIDMLLGILKKEYLADMYVLPAVRELLEK